MMAVTIAALVFGAGIFGLGLWAARAMRLTQAHNNYVQVNRDEKGQVPGQMYGRSA
jgi:uncharacterized membrane protein YiaA